MDANDELLYHVVHDGEELVYAFQDEGIILINTCAGGFMPIRAEFLGDATVDTEAGEVIIPV